MSEIPEERNDTLRQTQDYLETKQELERLFVHVTLLEPKTAWLPTKCQEFEKNCLGLLPNWEEAKRTAEVFRNLKNSEGFQGLSPKFQSMIKMFAYLGLVESLGVRAMDLALLILIANEKELHTRGPYSKHVEFLKELEDIWDMDYKLDFLIKSNIPIFRNKIVNKDTRDIIAHLKFRVQDNGEIRDRGNNLIDIDQRISDFWTGFDTLEIILIDIGFWKWIERRAKKRKRIEG